MARSSRPPRPPRKPRAPRSHDGWLIGWGALVALFLLALIAYILLYRPHP